MRQIVLFIYMSLVGISCYGESIFVVGEPYYRGSTTYQEKDECVEAGKCIEVAWYREYKIENLLLLSGQIEGEKITFVMQSHSPRYTNGEDSGKWFLEIVPIGTKEAKYKAIHWFPISEVVCARKALTSKDTNLKNWYTSTEGEPCYDLVDLIEAKNISNKSIQPTAKASAD